MLKIEPPLGWSFGKTTSDSLRFLKVVRDLLLLIMVFDCFALGSSSPEPTSVELHVDGVSDICTKEEDINFVFTGFSISGTVRINHR